MSMKKVVKHNAIELIKEIVRNQTMQIEKNRRAINKLADENASLKRVRARQIQVLKDIEAA
jgi:hypothetical protein